MRIDQKLNLVIPVELGGVGTVYVHSVPLRRDVFEKYFLVISKTFAAIYSEGLSAIAGPRIAYLMLKHIAKEAACWDTKGGVEEGLIAEIMRTTTVLMPSCDGWGMHMLADSIKAETFTPDEADEILGAVVFFICASAIHRKGMLAEVLEAMAGLWGTSTTSLNCTEYRGFLLKSMLASSTPAEQPAPTVSSIIY